MSEEQRITHCPRGHAYTDKGLRLKSMPDGSTEVRRKCFICRAEKKARETAAPLPQEPPELEEAPEPSKPEGNWRDNAAGVMELVNERGEVIEIAKRKPPRVRKDGSINTSGVRRGRPLDEDKSRFHQVLAGNGELITVPKGTNPDNLPGTVWPFSQVTCEHILQFITEGKTLNAVGEMEGIPPARTIHRWLREYPEFRAQMNLAKKARAEHRADKVMAIADSGQIHENDVPGEKLRADILKWGAEMDDRESYGKQTKVTNTGTAPTIIIFKTGVPDPVTVDVKAEVKGV